MTPAAFRQLALEIPSAVESAHMNHPDFRLRGKIFATLGAPDEDHGMVKLTPEQQRTFMQATPKVFHPCAGAWGRNGCTYVRLALAPQRVVRAALAAAAANVAQTATRRRSAAARKASSPLPEDPMPKPKTKSNDREIVSTRVIAAPRDLIWRAWTEPEHLARWWGPRGYRNTFNAFELKPGGKWRFVMHSPDGRDYANESIFREIVPLERIVFDHVSAHRFRVTATFQEVEGGTRVTFRMLHDSAEDCAKVKPFVVPANEENFDRLEKELAKMRAAGSK